MRHHCDRGDLELAAQTDTVRKEILYMGRTAAEALREEAALQMRKKILIRLLGLKFKKKVTPAVVAAIEATQDAHQLDAWVDRFVNAQTLEEVGIPLP
jgi:hypothetical protein